MYQIIRLRAGVNQAAIASHWGTERVLVTVDGHATTVRSRRGRPVAATDSSPIGEVDCPSIACPLLKSTNSIVGPLKGQSRNSNQVTHISCSERTKLSAFAMRPRKIVRYGRACMPRCMKQNRSRLRGGQHGRK